MAPHSARQKLAVWSPPSVASVGDSFGWQGKEPAPYIQEHGLDSPLDVLRSVDLAAAQLVLQLRRLALCFVSFVLSWVSVSLPAPPDVGDVPRHRWLKFI